MLAKPLTEIKMVDLGAQYQSLKTEIDQAVQGVLDSQAFINGPEVKSFEKELASYNKAGFAIACGNGTDALQIALMALDLNQGDEVIIPSFTYVATAEVIVLLGLKPVMVDVDYNTFNINVAELEKAIGPKTKVIVPVHLFGQCVDMEALMEIANAHNLYVIEDNAQSIGADYTFSDGSKKKSGTLGHIGCTSFYPSKNLGAFGDGGAIITNDEVLANKLRRIANHGQAKRYYHSMVGVNSRLDSMQACILNVKLKHLDHFNAKRKELADFYRAELNNISELDLPKLNPNSNHVYHQFTLKVLNDKREALQSHLKENGIPTMIYYPVPLYKQEAYAKWFSGTPHKVTEKLSDEVLSLPMHPNMEQSQAEYITKTIKQFYS